jgi:hypothetical protein
MALTCPHCSAQLPREQALVEHLWQEHRLVLDGQLARDPWSLIEEWLDCHQAEPNPELLQRCRTLAGRLEGPAGLERLHRRLWQRDLADDQARQTLLDDARRRQATLCPRCQTAVPVPADTPVPDLSLGQGRLLGRGYRVEVSEAGWRTRLEIVTPRGLLFQGREPWWHWTARGALVLLVGPLVLLALACAFGLLGVSAPLLPVLLLLALALGAYLLIRRYWRPAEPADRRVCRHAWQLLAPRLHQGGYLADDADFLAGLARLSAGDGLASMRTETLPFLLRVTEKAAADRIGAPGPLVELARLQVADAAEQGHDAVAVLAEQLAHCFEGRLPMPWADALLERWPASWWTDQAQARLRILLCDRAFEAGFEVGNLLDVAGVAPRLGWLLGCGDARTLAALRLLWSLRPGRPWDRCGPSATVFDLALKPARAGVLVGRPDLLLHQEEPDWPLIAVGAEREHQPVVIQLSAAGVWVRDLLFTERPRQTEMRTEWRSCELRLGPHVIRSRQVLDLLEDRLDRWLRFAFLDFLPRLSSVMGWKPPEVEIVHRGRATVPCPGCGAGLRGRCGAVAECVSSA